MKRRFQAALLFALSTTAVFAQRAVVVTIKVPGVVEQTAQPVYPAAALAQTLIGNGAVDVSVDREGSATAVNLVEWTNLNFDGDALGLDDATIAAIRKWRFKPLIIDGTAVPFEVRIGFVVRPEGMTFTNMKPEPKTRRGSAKPPA